MLFIRSKTGCPSQLLTGIQFLVRGVGHEHGADQSRLVEKRVS